MQIGRAAALLAALAIPVVAQAQSAPGWQQTLQGMFTGNQSQDDALRQAYQRGYERGRDDEARATRAGRGDRYRGGQYGSDYNGPSPQGYPGR